MNWIAKLKTSTIFNFPTFINRADTFSVHFKICQAIIKYGSKKWKSEFRLYCLRLSLKGDNFEFSICSIFSQKHLVWSDLKWSTFIGKNFNWLFCRRGCLTILRAKILSGNYLHPSECKYLIHFIIFLGGVLLAGILKVMLHIFCC